MTEGRGRDGEIQILVKILLGFQELDIFYVWYWAMAHTLTGRQLGKMDKGIDPP